jgi:hypothetical protein
MTWTPERFRRGVRRVRVLPCGFEEGDKENLTLLKDCGTIMRIPHDAYLIEDPNSTAIVGL